jgi:hypothetical protein
VELKLDDTDEERLDSTLEDDEVGDEESAELFELDELEVWEFVEE